MNTTNSRPLPETRAAIFHDRVAPLVETCGEQCGPGVTRLEIGMFAAELVASKNQTPALSVSLRGCGLVLALRRHADAVEVLEYAPGAWDGELLALVAIAHEAITEATLDHAPRA